MLQLSSKSSSNQSIFERQLGVVEDLGLTENIDQSISLWVKHIELEEVPKCDDQLILDTTKFKLENDIEPKN